MKIILLRHIILRKFYVKMIFMLELITKTTHWNVCNKYSLLQLLLSQASTSS
jgi:hypothetical protein